MKYWKPRFDIEQALLSLANRLDRIEARLTVITYWEKEIMSVEDDLVAAVAALQANAKAASDAIAAELAVIAKAPKDDTAAIAAAVASITAVNDGLAAAVASTLPPAPAPVVVEPAPAPAVEPAPAPVVDTPPAV
jgi:hypothetical protein